MYRYPIIFAVVVLTLITGILLLAGGNNSKSKTVSHSQVKPLQTYADTDAKVVMTIDGHINGDDAHRAIRITISRDERDLDVIQGYSGTVIDHQQLYNTQDAYTVFLRAMAISGYLEPLKNSKYPADERGQCSTGFRYIFDLNQDGKDLSRLWTSSCGTSIGTFGGNAELIEGLFEAQFPDYQTTADGVAL